jgi:hypothetical protein
MNPYLFLTIALSIWSIATFSIWYYEYQEYTYTGKYDTVTFNAGGILEYKTNYYYSDNYIETVYHHTRSISDSYQPQNTVWKYISLFGGKYNSLIEYLLLRFMWTIFPMPILIAFLGMTYCAFEELKKDMMKKKHQ